MCDIESSSSRSYASSLILLNKIPSVFEMKISGESSTGFPLTRLHCCSRSSISRSSTGFLPCCRGSLVNMSPVLTFKLDEVREELCLAFNRLFQRVSVCCHRAVQTGSF